MKSENYSDKNRNQVLVFNLGSSSLKFSVYLIGGGEEKLLASGAAERIGLEGGRLWMQSGPGRLEEKKNFAAKKHEDAVRAIFDLIERLEIPKNQKNQKPSAVGHRVVHGGPGHAAPAVVDQKLLGELKGLVPFAPLHLPYEIRCIEAVARHYPHLPQVACFDTAFHRGMPEAARRFPLPASFWDEGILRYGFHGLSYEYAVSVLGEEARGRVVIAHLGNGASMAAIKNGRPIDTTMGFTPAGGFMMGTRSGDLDPGVLLYLINQKGFSAARIDELVNHKAGLLGVSEISPDMKTLLEKRKELPSAALAIDMFCYQLKKNIGALAAALGGLDTLVFTGGIGEKAAPVRWQACQGLEHLGIRIDERKNERHEAVISMPDSRCAVRVVQANEDLMIARHTAAILFQKAR
ncbi:MAG: acetate/propionate family kinase [Nitrospiraceae bacterium]|nr:acetate/propionate family kinase [Nitrospiraceae bacterium]